MAILEIKKDGLLFDGKPFYLACGDMQYFRIHPSEWRERLIMMRDFGLTAVQTYCAWNLHEPNEGEFCFTGLCDLSAFLKICDEVGMKVMLRPTPYICGEWDFGGLPWWLLKDRNMRFRCAYPAFLEKIKVYYKELCKQFVPYLSTNGGPVIAVCIENEYGTFGTDLTYLNFLKDTLAENGVDVPFYQTDCTPVGIAFTKPLNTWQAINYRIESATAIPALQKIQTDLPPFVGEYWSGRSVYWGESGAKREVAPIAAAYRTALDLGAYVCFYMFTGGTNFGFMNGTRVTSGFGGKGAKMFRAITTSYDCDALISESGRATEKYYACRRELDEYLQKPVRDYRLPNPPSQAIPAVRLTEAAPLYDNLSVLTTVVKSAETLTFEELDCPYGFVLYRTVLPVCDGRELAVTLTKVRDRAMVYLDGEYVGVYRRDCEDPIIRCLSDKPHTLEILVENLGRTNTRPEFIEEKGLLGEVKYGISRVYSFENMPLPMNDFSKLDWKEKDTVTADGKPCFYRAYFDAQAGISTNLSIKGIGKGFAVINGFNIGRYWEIGPQATLYIPGALLKDKANELILFELTDKSPETIDFDADAVLDGTFREDLV